MGVSVRRIDSAKWLTYSRTIIARARLVMEAKWGGKRSPVLVYISSPNFKHPFLAWLVRYKNIHQTVMMSALL